MDLLTWIREHGWSTVNGVRVPTSLMQCAEHWGISYERLRAIAHRRASASYRIGKIIVAQTGGLVDLETVCGDPPGKVRAPRTQRAQRAPRTAPPPPPPAAAPRARVAAPPPPPPPAPAAVATPKRNGRKPAPPPPSPSAVAQRGEV